jgi:hypothetical protein
MSGSSCTLWTRPGVKGLAGGRLRNPFLFAIHYLTKPLP